MSDRLSCLRTADRPHDHPRAEHHRQPAQIVRSRSNTSPAHFAVGVAVGVTAPLVRDAATILMSASSVNAPSSISSPTLAVET